MRGRVDDCGKGFAVFCRGFGNDLHPCLFSSTLCKRMVMELMISWIMTKEGSCGDLRREASVEQ